MNWAHSSLSAVWYIISSPIRVQTFTWLIVTQTLVNAGQGILQVWQGEGDRYRSPISCFTCLHQKHAKSKSENRKRSNDCLHFLIHSQCKSIVIVYRTMCLIVSRLLTFKMSWNWSDDIPSPSRTRSVVSWHLTNGRPGDWSVQWSVARPGSHWSGGLVNGQQYTRCTHLTSDNFILTETRRGRAVTFL